MYVRTCAHACVRTYVRAYITGLLSVYDQSLSTECVTVPCPLLPTAPVQGEESGVLSGQGGQGV